MKQPKSLPTKLNVLLNRVNSDDAKLKSLILELDKELAVTDGKEHAYYNQFNGLSDIKHIILCSYAETPIACGAFKHFNDNTVEIKRMYTSKQYRGQRIGPLILSELESWAKKTGYSRCILETGVKQLSAIKMYKTAGYTPINNYAQYAGRKSSLCFEKIL